MNELNHVTLSPARIANSEASLTFKITFLIAVAAGLASICFLPFPDDPARHLQVGYLIGSTLSMAIVAASCAALGPGNVLQRLGLSLCWSASLSVAWFVSIYFDSNSEFLAILAWLMAACIATIWVLLTGLLGALRLFGKIRIAKPLDADASLAVSQYGIRQLLIFTTLIALILGAARVTISFTQITLADLGLASVIFGLLIVAAVLLVLPLLLAMLLPRYWIAASAGAIAFIMVGTTLEWPLFMQVTRNTGGPELEDFIWINTFTAFWVLLFSGLARVGGYRLVRGAARGA